MRADEGNRTLTFCLHGPQTISRRLPLSHLDHRPMPALRRGRGNLPVQLRPPLGSALSAKPSALITAMEREATAHEPMTPAHLAVEHGDLEELTRMLDAGVDPNEVWSGMTLLLHAIDVEADGAAQTREPLDAACTAVLLAPATAR